MDRDLGVLFRLGRGEGGGLGKPPERRRRAVTSVIGRHRWGLLLGVMSHIFFTVKCYTARIFAVNCYT